MSLRVGQRVRTYYTRETGVIVGVCPHDSGNWHVEVDGSMSCQIRCAAACNLTPLPEPEREARECSHVEKCGRPHEWVSVGGKAYCDPMNGTCTLHSYASRLSLITYPELFICSKAGECKKCLCANDHKVPHAHYTACKVDCPFVQARCIPYVPEDEGPWLVLGRYRRAFKWSTGLKGAPCE